MIIRILPSALDDLRSGWRFYESLQEGLGDDFQDTLFSDMESLVLYAGIQRMVYGYHRLLSKRFPYAVYYRFENEDQILIYRVLDMRRDPRGISDDLVND